MQEEEVQKALAQEAMAQVAGYKLKPRACVYEGKKKGIGEIYSRNSGSEVSGT